MGIIPTVAKKPESQQTTTANGDDKKLMVNLSSKIEELKVQNLENAKFLRGISRKIDNELSQIREFEEGKSTDIYDDTVLLEGIERIENSVKGMNLDEVLYELDKIGKTIGQLDLGSLPEKIQKINDSMQSINTEHIVEELDKMNNTLLEFNADVIFLEIDKVNRSLKQINSDNVLQEIELVNENVSRLNTDAIMGELNRLEAIISEINSNAVLAELGRLRMLITEKDSGADFKKLDMKLDRISKQNNTSQFEEIKDMLIQNAQHIDNIQVKLERISSMPVMVKSIIQSENENNLKRIDEHLIDLTRQQDSKMSGLKSIIGFNLWLSLLAVVLIIVNILGII